MRLEGHMRCGFCPTPANVTTRLRRLVRFSEEPCSVLDPCGGEGTALAGLVKDSGAVTYGIELDRRRASRARSRLGHVIRSDFFRSRISRASVSLMLLNPPYASDSEDGRLELAFLKAAHPLLKTGGVLIYIVPQGRVTARVARILAAHFEDIRLYRFPKDEFERFGQIIVMGVRREHASRDGVPDALVNVPEKKLKVLPARAKPVYDVPPSPPIPLFRSTEIDPDALAEELKASPLGRTEVGPKNVGRDRPPVPLHAGHVALLLAAGELDGVVGKGRDRHVVRGYVKKTTDTTREEDARGNETVRETERFEVQIKTLSRDGEVRVLEGA